MATKEQERDLAEMDAIYDRYVQPLEADHWGELVAVSRDGRVLLGEDELELMRDAREAFGSGNFLYKVGPRVIGKWRGGSLKWSTHDPDEERRRIEADRLYERYGKPLEEEHWGRYVAISPDGRTLLGDDVREVGRAAKDAFGPGNYVFKIGPRVTGKWL